MVIKVSYVDVTEPSVGRLVGAGDDSNIVAILTVGKWYRLGLGQSIKSIDLCPKYRTLMSSSRRLVGAGDDFNVVAILTACQ